MSRPNREDLAILEAILFQSTRPVLTDHLRNLTGWDKKYVDAGMARLMEEYKDRGIHVRKVAGGYQMVTAPGAAAVVEKMQSEVKRVSLSRAQIETLTIIAYKQPITRARVEELRGVSVDHVIQKLFERGFIREMGHAQAPGRPALLGTTRKFLEHFNLDRLEDLPKLPDLAALEDTDREPLEGPLIGDQLTLEEAVES